MGMVLLGSRNYDHNDKHKSCLDISSEYDTGNISFSFSCIENCFGSNVLCNINLRFLHLPGIWSEFYLISIDTILKKYSSTVATIFTGIASAVLFGHTLTMNFVLGISIVFISMHQVLDWWQHFPSFPFDKSFTANLLILVLHCLKYKLCFSYSLFIWNLMVV